MRESTTPHVGSECNFFTESGDRIAKFESAFDEHFTSDEMKKLCRLLVVAIVVSDSVVK